MDTALTREELLHVERWEHRDAGVFLCAIIRRLDAQVVKYREASASPEKESA